MTYKRHDKDCNPAVQPAHTVATDDFGNTFENWCADFVGHDKDINPNGKTGCAPQDPDLLLGKWEHWNFDVTAQRPLSSYIKSPTTVITFAPIVGETILGLTQTRDIILLSQDTPFLRLEDNTLMMSDANTMVVYIDY